MERAAVPAHPKEVSFKQTEEPEGAPSFFLDLLLEDVDPPFRKLHVVLPEICNGRERCIGCRAWLPACMIPIMVAAGMRLVPVRRPDNMSMSNTT